MNTVCLLFLFMLGWFAVAGILICYHTPLGFIGGMAAAASIGLGILFALLGLFGILYKNR